MKIIKDELYYKILKLNEQTIEMNEQLEQIADKNSQEYIELFDKKEKTFALNNGLLKEYEKAHSYEMLQRVVMEIVMQLLDYRQKKRGTK